MPTPVATPTPTVTPVSSGLPVQKLFLLRGKPPTDVDIDQYELTVTNILSSMVFNGVTFNLRGECVRPEGLFTTLAGTLLFVVDSNVNSGTGTVYKYSLSAWDLSTTVYTGQSVDVTQNPVNVGLVFRPIDIQLDSTGNTLFILDAASNTIYQYTLGTPYDLTTLVYASKSLVVEISQDKPMIPLSFNFGNWGNKLYVLDSYTNSVHQYAMNVLYDISTARYEKTFQTRTSTVYAMSLSADGTRMFIDTGASFNSYAMPVNWEVDSAYLISSYNATVDGVDRDLNLRAADAALVSPTVTPTNTVTPAVTGTPESTPTITPTNTTTPHVTYTNTPTPTVTATVTKTPHVTFTPTSTSAVTPTNTSTSAVTPTVTRTANITPSPTPSSTATPTPTPPATPAVTSTPGVTTTPAVTPTTTAPVTPTATAAVTPTATAAVTITPTVTDTPDVTPTNTAAVTITPTVTDTPDATAAVTPTPTAAVTQTITPTVTDTPDATPAVTPTTTAPVTPTITPTISQTLTVTPTPTITPTLTTTVTPTLTMTVTPSPTL